MSVTKRFYYISKQICSFFNIEEKDGISHVIVSKVLFIIALKDGLISFHLVSELKYFGFRLKCVGFGWGCMLTEIMFWGSDRVAVQHKFSWRNLVRFWVAIRWHIEHRIKKKLSSPDWVVI